jgi:hypothetical protein
MILPAANDIETKSVGEITEYKMGIDAADQGIIFEFLRSKIYKRPIDAICREIMSNSRDANREVGKADVPITVGIIEGGSLIDGSSISIYFKDQGPGISPDRMGNVFCKYAASTKRDTNFQTGGFGLGAKTPFSYTDVFSVETVVDGIKYIYTAYIDESKRGIIILQSQDQVLEPNGTAIVVPLLNKNDRIKFEVACRYYSMFWSVDPIFENFQTNKVEYSIQQHDTVDGVTFSVLESTDSTLPKGNILIIDGVPYEIDVEQIGYGSIDRKIADKFILALHFENGDLDVAISREALQYTEDVKTKLTHAYETVKTYLNDIFSKYIDIADNYFDAALLNYSFVNQTSQIAKDINVKYPSSTFMGFAHTWLKNLGTSFDFTYKGRPIHKNVENSLLQMFVFKTASLNDLHTSGFYDISLHELNKAKGLVYYLEPGKSLNERKTYSIFQNVTPQADGSLVFYVVRVKTYSSGRSRYSYHDDAEKFKAKAEAYFNEFVGDFAEILTNYNDVTPLKSSPVSKKYAIDELTSIKIRRILRYKSDDEASIIYYSKLLKKFYSSSYSVNITTRSELEIYYYQVSSFADYSVPNDVRAKALFIKRMFPNCLCILINEKALRYFDGKTIREKYDEISKEKRFETLRVARTIINMYDEIIESKYVDYDCNAYGHRDSVLKLVDKAKKIKKNQSLMSLIKFDGIDVILNDWTVPAEFKAIEVEIKAMSKVYPLLRDLGYTNKTQHIKHINMYIKTVNEQRKFSQFNKLKID